MENTVQEAINALFDSDIRSEYVLTIANALKKEEKVDLNLPKQATKLSEAIGIKFDHNSEKTLQSLGFSDLSIVKGSAAIANLADKEFAKNSQVLEYILDEDYQGKNELITMLLLKGVSKLS